MKKKKYLNKNAGWFVLLFAAVFSAQAQQHPVYPVKVPNAAEKAVLDAVPVWRGGLSRAVDLPDGVDNSLKKYFPPVFSQQGNSCSQASGIRYMFTYEINRLLDREVVDNNQIFSYFYTWNFLNDGKDEGSFPEMGLNLTKKNGAMTLADMPDISADKRWQSGYDKYLRAMHYRTKSISKIPMKTKEGIEQVMRYLYDRGDGSSSGGVVTFSCKAANFTPATYTGTSVTGIKKYIDRLPDDGAHALTIVGYDRTVSFDLNGDGAIQEDEKGAFIFVNSWGTWWGDQGKSYFPFKFFLDPVENGGLSESDATATCMTPEIHEPKIVFKVKLNYTSRNDLSFTLGVADGEDADVPEYSMAVDIMSRQGGDFPMQGYAYLANANEMEVALNFTDMLPRMESFKKPKYFLEVRQIVNGEKGSGMIEHFSVVDYRSGSENPKEFVCENAEGTVIKGATKLTVATTAPRTSVSCSPEQWKDKETQKVKSGIFFMKTADGRYVKVQFTGYDKNTGKATFRYFYQGDGSRNLRR